MMNDLNSPSIATSGNGDLQSPYNQQKNQQPTNPYSQTPSTSSPNQNQQQQSSSSPYQQSSSASSSSPYQPSSSPYQQQQQHQQYGSYGADAGGYAGGSTTTPSSMRRRVHTTPTYSPYDSGAGGGYGSSDMGSDSSSRSQYSSKKKPGSGKMSSLKTLDFFPKIETDLTVQTSHGGFLSLAMYGLIVILCITEISSHRASNAETAEHVVVDTALNKRMRINLNMTFPSLACEDLHVDAMDVAGDSQINMQDTFKKIRLYEDGVQVSKTEIDAEVNAKHKADDEKQKILKAKLSDDYCGPCYGAKGEHTGDDHEHDKENKANGNCCQTCDELIDAYKEKRWAYDNLIPAAEQCVREGVHAKKPKMMTQGEGCQIAGYMVVNRVNGNFHIAMGEGVERDGRHIHLFNPEDTKNFNSSHIIHELSFGEPKKGMPNSIEDLENHWDAEGNVLNGATKIVTEKSGSTGLFQYFVKVVPTVYKNKNGIDRETNRFFFTERFRPLYTDLEKEHYDLGEKKKYMDDLDGKKKNMDNKDAHMNDDDHIDGGHGHDYYYEYHYHEEEEESFTEKIKHTFAASLSKDAAPNGNGINFVKNPDDKHKEKEEEQENQEKENVKVKEEEEKFQSEKAEKDRKTHAGAKIGGAHGGSHDHKDHHKVQNALIPGVFFIYEVYPFAVEIRHNSVPLTHLILRIMAVIGGVVTITGWVDKFLYASDVKKKGFSGR